MVRNFSLSIKPETQWGEKSEIERERSRERVLSDALGFEDSWKIRRRDQRREKNEDLVKNIEDIIFGNAFLGQIFILDETFSF